MDIGKIIYRIKIMIILSCLWMVFVEKLSIGQFFIGFIVSFFVMLIRNLIIPRKHNNVIKFNLFYVLGYLLYLVYQVYSSGIDAIISVIKGREETNLVTYKTELSGELERCILANAITLTPGTITISKEEDILTILNLNEFNLKACVSFEKLICKSIKTRKEERV